MLPGDPGDPGALVFESTGRSPFLPPSAAGDTIPTMKRASLLLAFAASCAPDAAARDSARLAPPVADMPRQTDGARHALHELENRVFVLEDKLDTAQVERDRTAGVPRLPVVSKRPEPTPAAAEPPAESGEEQPP